MRRIAFVAAACALSAFAQPRAILKERGKMTDADLQKMLQGQVVTRVLPSTDNLREYMRHLSARPTFARVPSGFGHWPHSRKWAKRLDERGSPTNIGA